MGWILYISDWVRFVAVWAAYCCQWAIYAAVAGTAAREWLGTMDGSTITLGGIQR